MRGEKAEYLRGKILNFVQFAQGGGRNPMPGDGQILMVQNCPSLGTLLSRQATCVVFILCFSDQGSHSLAVLACLGWGSREGGVNQLPDHSSSSWLYLV